MSKTKRYYNVDQVQNGLWYQVGHFHSKLAAERFRQALSGRTRIKKTWPGHDYPAVRKNTLVGRSR
jgi:hypothetical protein